MQPSLLTIRKLRGKKNNEQQVKIGGEAKAHLIEWPSASSTFHVALKVSLLLVFSGRAAKFFMKVILKTATLSDKVAYFLRMVAYGMKGNFAMVP